MSSTFAWIAAVLSVGSVLAGCAAPHPAGAKVAPATQPAVSIRVMTYNIHHGVGEDGKFDPQRIADLIRREHPDIVAIQEVDVRTDRINGVDLAAELGRLTGMQPHFGKAIDFQNGEYGQVVLSRLPITDASVHTLPGDPAREQRIALETRITWEIGPAGELRFVTAHLDATGGSPDRLSQAQALVDHFGAGDATPTILAGDFNCTPGSEPHRIIGSAFRDTGAEHDQPTYPAPDPARRIDYVFVPTSGAWTLEDSHVVNEPNASDHRPFVVDLRLTLSPSAFGLRRPGA